MWHEKAEIKKEIIGKLATTTTCKGDGDRDLPVGVPKPAPGPHGEVVFWHNRAQAFNEELLHSCEVMSVIDLTMGGGTMAAACILNRVPYVGVGLTPTHCERMKRYLDQRIFREMGEADSEVFEKSMHAALHNQAEEGVESSERGEADLRSLAAGKAKAKAKGKAAAKGGGKPAAKGKAKGSTKAAAKAKPATGGDDDNDDDGDEEETEDSASATASAA